jgi:hypothetical protein
MGSVNKINGRKEEWVAPPTTKDVGCRRPIFL